MKLVVVRIITPLKAGRIIDPVIALTQESGYVVKGCNLDKLHEQIAFFKLEVPDNLDDEVIVQMCEKHFGQGNVTFTEEDIVFP
jgi:hypothetical protein